MTDNDHALGSPGVKSVRLTYSDDDPVVTRFFEQASINKSAAMRNLIYLFAADYGSDADVVSVVRDRLLQTAVATKPEHMSADREDSDMSTKSEKNTGTRSRVRKPADPISVAEPGSAELSSDTQSVTPPVTTGTEQQAPAPEVQPKPKSQPQQQQQPEVDFDDMDSIFGAMNR